MMIWLNFLKQCIGDKKDGLIFASSVDKLVTTNQVNYQYANTLKKYDILDKSVYGKVDLHSLRHTYATRCIEIRYACKGTAKSSQVILI